MRWLELTEKTFRFATYARKAFLFGGLELKKEILLALGTTPVIQNEMITIEPNDWFAPINKSYPALEKEYKRLELNKMPMNASKNRALSSVITRWQGHKDLNLI